MTSTAGISLDDKEQPNDDKDIDDKLAELFYGGDKDAIHRPELDQALGRIGHAVDCLLRLSATIRHPAPHDQFKSRAGAELIEAFRALDKDHIRHKFVQLDEPLVDRLGKSMAMRRHYFKYREEHANRIARGLEEVEQGLKCDASEYTTTKTAISSLPGHLKDNKAIYTSTETSTTACADEFTDFDDMRSQTSYAPTEANSSELRVPRIPPEYVDGPFKCPYCHMIIVIETRHEWKYNPPLLSYIHEKKEIRTSSGLTDTLFQETHLPRLATLYLPCKDVYHPKSTVLSALGMGHAHGTRALEGLALLSRLHRCFLR